jgi:hypothetical protein
MPGLVPGICDGHEVSILIELIRCVRGEQPRAKVSMMIMRPPHHGYGYERFRSSASAG